MGRSRVRGKKQTSTAARQDHASGEEEKIPVKRRGRPLKLVRNDSPQKEAHDFDQLGDEDYTDGILSDKHVNAPPSVINTGIKRTRTSDIDDNHGMAKQEIGADIKNNNNDPVKLVGFRQIGSRRKNKPRRAAEVGLECR
ncbi:hypothetical protein DCAR_0522643 [Daucus carota subsp. sativus]|uniref:Uncharacterized protein n=1 Tax=Daucus carota subsp. sativus TaxID=79200 RepID=A0AAF1B425_DAUCS|nr:PREDICTED: uncharacterized protein LOC108221064 [Daucus carota subsp. sativus]WOH03247.1 hypothetical protein DCAR_0522643 [Daucus carota subsp. sativus]